MIVVVVGVAAVVVIVVVRVAVATLTHRPVAMVFIVIVRMHREASAAVARCGATAAPWAAGIDGCDRRSGAVLRVHDRQQAAEDGSEGEASAHDRRRRKRMAEDESCAR